MDCGTISNLFARFACIVNDSRVDAYFGFSVLVFIGVGGMAALLHTLITHWNGLPTKQPEPPGRPLPIKIVVIVGAGLLMIYALGIGGFALGLLSSAA